MRLSETVLELAINLQASRSYGWVSFVDEIQSSGTEPIRARPKFNEADILLPSESLADVSVLKMSWGLRKGWLLAYLTVDPPSLAKGPTLKTHFLLKLEINGESLACHSADKPTKWLTWRKHLPLWITYFEITWVKSCSLLPDNLHLVYIHQCPSKFWNTI